LEKIVTNTVQVAPRNRHFVPLAFSGPPFPAMLISMNARLRPTLAALTVALALTSAALLAQPQADIPFFKTADIGHGIRLHYAEQGRGTPVIFVHGSLADYGYWEDQIGPFSKHFHAIAYSRRYNFPNTNPAQAGYSAVVDADDLAAFIKKLGLGRVDIVGHSYGALTALFLAHRHPELLRKVVLAEPPAVPLLGHLEGDGSGVALASFRQAQPIV
jgi:triacylglycerol esterase/lipase EstA (alpha/beta hydrolase family)